MRLVRGIAVIVTLWGAGLAPDAAWARVNCVEFARQASSVALAGDAWTWWGKAQSAYDTGAAPEEGAVLVFKRTHRMRSGHVAVVRDVLDSRTITIDHANWGSGRATKGQVTRNVLVEDASPNNDWTTVRVWHQPSQSYGSPYATYGFIYESQPPLRRLASR